MTETMDPYESPAYIRDLSKAIYTYFDQAVDNPPPAT
jgi:hypothetical protein